MSREKEFDSSYIDPLVDEWLKHFHDIQREQETSYKEGNQTYMPFVAIPEPIITAIFKVTEYLDLNAHTKYLAIHLYDKFMCNHFWEIYKSHISNALSDNSWREICKRISYQSKLYLMSCLQLASKMDLHTNCLGISQIIEVLNCIDGKRDYTHDIVLQSEIEVFKTLNFRISLDTPLNCIEVLLAAGHLLEIPNIYETSISLLDLAYLQHEQLYSHLYLLVQDELPESTGEDNAAMRMLPLKSNILLLSASVILCATFFLPMKNSIVENITVKLEQLIDVQGSDILNIAKILVLMATQE